MCAAACWGAEMFTAHGGFFYVPMLAPMVGAIVGGGFFKAFIDLSDGGDAGGNTDGDDDIDDTEDTDDTDDDDDDGKRNADATAAPVVKDEELELGIAGSERRGGKDHQLSTKPATITTVPSFFSRIDRTKRGGGKLGRRAETIVNLAIEEGSLRRERSIQNLVAGRNGKV